MHTDHHQPSHLAAPKIAKVRTVPQFDSINCGNKSVHARELQLRL
jgi:hypothetical protein